MYGIPEKYSVLLTSYFLIQQFVLIAYITGVEYIIRSLYNDVFFQKLRLYSFKWKVISEWQNGKDLDGSGNGLILRYRPDFWLEGLRKTAKTSVRLAGLRAEISTWYL
jgi:hypothetical protein